MKRIVMHWKVRVWWQELWVRRDEFHKTLDIDTRAVLKMAQVERRSYFKNLEVRRNKAHKNNKARNKKSLEKFLVWVKTEFETEMKKRGITLKKGDGHERNNA